MRGGRPFCRREFLRAGACAGVGALVPTPACASSGEFEVKFTVFGDIHYSPGGYPHSERAWLERILRRGVETKSDFVISLGDFCHYAVRDRAYVDFYNDYKAVRTYHVFGNHDFDCYSHEEVRDCFRLESGYYSFVCNGFRFVVLDPNYYLADGKYFHYSRRGAEARAGRPPQGAVEPILPPEQVTWFRQTVNDSREPCVVFSHQSLEYDYYAAVTNSKEIHDIVSEVNARHPGRVRLFVNGHDHWDHLRFIDGVPYLDLNSASFDIFSQKHDKYPESFVKQCSGAPWLLTWNDPLSAVITLRSDGTLRIDGAKSSYFLGVTPEQAGLSGNRTRRATHPQIQSADLKLCYN